MSHEDAEEASRDDSPSSSSAALGSIDPAPAVSFSEVPDFFADNFPGKPPDLDLNLAASSRTIPATEPAGEPAEEPGEKNVGAAHFVESTDEGAGGANGATGEAASEGLLRSGKADEPPGIGDPIDVVGEATMAETLINGLHQMEHGEGLDQQVESGKMLTPEKQGAGVATQGADRIGSPRRKVGNGAESPKGALPVEHHRQPPISGSQSGGPLDKRTFDGQEGPPLRPASEGTSNIVGEVLHSIASEDEEGRSRQRILAFAAKRYSTAVERNPNDHDALYNWALVLQESADNTTPEVGNSGKDALLDEACKKYEAAVTLCPTLHEAFYNWAIAISDRAKIRGRTKEAEELWKQACERYDKAVQLNWNSPQALNNWGLALQELGAIVPMKEKRAIVKKAIRKFRAAIGLRFDFHRAVYNLGTVLYGLAEDTLRGERKLVVKESSPADLYSQSAIYIAAAHALKPDYPVYRSALRLVRSMLPLPYVKAGYLSMPPVDDSLAPHSEWQRLWFVLDHEALYEIEKPERKPLSASTSRKVSGIGESSNTSGAMPLRPSVLRIEMEDIMRMTPCADLSLPPGGGFRIDTITGQVFVIADTWESMDGWVDAIRLVYTIFARGKQDALAGVLAG